MAVEHMVWIKFHEHVDEERIGEHLSSLSGLSDQVPGILELKVGENFSHRSGGFTHGMLVRFADRSALQHYAEHPEHVRVANALIADAEVRALDIET